MHHRSQRGPSLKHESERRCGLFFKSALEGFAYCRMLYDQEGRPDDFIYLAVNPAFERLTGLKDVVGKRLTEVAPTAKDGTPEILDIYSRVAQTGEPVEFEIDCTPLGLWLHVSARQPEPGHFVTVFTDVTERKEAEKQVRSASLYARSLIEASLNPLLTISPEGKIHRRQRGHRAGDGRASRAAHRHRLLRLFHAARRSRRRLPAGVRAGNPSATTLSPCDTPRAQSPTCSTAPASTVTRAARWPACSPRPGTSPSASAPRQNSPPER